MSNKHVKYDRHEEAWEACINDPQRRKVGMTWLDQKNTLDRWRHNRMYSLVSPIIKSEPEATWLTVGDGRYGTDAHALLTMGAENVHCSDISDTLLKIGHQKGFIRNYSVENAESLSFPDSSFDFVYCKEAFHHFPRPYIALHEMFRVAKKAVILTEPRDSLVDSGIFQPIITIIKRILGKSEQLHGFETIGNYVYSISKREMEKFLLGMHYNYIAYNSLNDVYESGVEFIDMDSEDRTDKKVIQRVKFRIFLKDMLDVIGIRKKNLLSVILFKQEPSGDLREGLNSIGWEVKELPKNPYL